MIVIAESTVLHPLDFLVIFLVVVVALILIGRVRP